MDKKGLYHKLVASQIKVDDKKKEEIIINR